MSYVDMDGFKTYYEELPKRKGTRRTAYYLRSTRVDRHTFYNRSRKLLDQGLKWIGYK